MRRLRRPATVDGMGDVSTKPPRPGSRIKRDSIRATYDSRQTGPRYRYSTTVGNRVIDYQKPVDDPFIYTAISIGWRDLLAGLMRGRCQVTVNVGGADPEIIEDVLELDENYLGPNCTRRDAFHSHLNEALGRADAACVLDDDLE
jgi:hypothetical protein